MKKKKMPENKIVKNGDKTVLVVEDEVILSKAISKKLEINKYKPITARSVKQAMEILDELGKVDVVWLDHYLIGEENGLDFVIKLKNDGSEWKKIPIFVVSNTATKDKINAYIKLGVNKYYTKSNTSLDLIIDDIKGQVTE